jgi:hypothetical protein
LVLVGPGGHLPFGQRRPMKTHAIVSLLGGQAGRVE